MITVVSEIGGIMKKATLGKLWVGTSGYRYAHWAHGAFYPQGLKPADELSFYARHFDTFEINLSFYRLPKLENLQRWAKITPKRFVFAAKLNRTITHYRKLKDCAGTLARNRTLGEGLGKKLAVILAQLPPNFPADLSRLKDFLALLRSDAGSWIPRLAVEFRHPSWLSDDCYKILTDFGAAICLADWGSCEVRRPNDCDFVYIRRHGGHNAGCYTEQQIHEDAKLVNQYLARGKTIFVYYNNDLNCHAIRNAGELLAAAKRQSEN